MYKLLDFRHNPAKFLNHSTTFDMLRRSSGRDTKTSEKTGVAASDLGRRVLSECHAKLPRKRCFLLGNVVARSLASSYWQIVFIFLGNSSWIGKKVIPRRVLCTYQSFALGWEGRVSNPQEIWHFQVFNVNFPTLGSPFYKSNSYSPGDHRPCIGSW